MAIEYRVYTPRSIRHICEDVVFEAQTRAIELDLYLSWIERTKDGMGWHVEPVKAEEVLKDYQPDFADRDEVVREIEARGWASNEEVLFLRESTNWVIKGDMSPRMLETKARMAS